ncbi:Rid family hydrolase [Streptomyces sp. NPDC004838]
MINQTYRTDSAYETAGGYARGRRVGDHVYVAGTAAVLPNGDIHAPGDVYAQSILAFEKIEATLRELGAELTDVVRTRAYVADAAMLGEYARAHGEVFGGIFPVATGVAASLVDPQMLVEIDVDAIVTGGPDRA